MRTEKFFSILPFVFAFFLLVGMIIPAAIAEKTSLSMEGGMDIEIIYPDTVFPERKFPLSILVKNNGWEDKQDVTFTISTEDNSITPLSTEDLVINKISSGGSHGQTIDFQVSSEVLEGTHFINIEYSQVLVRNNEEPQPPTQSNIAIPIMVSEKPTVTIHTITPESIFTNAEFPFEIELISEDIELSDVSIQIIPPRDIEFRGETKHVFSTISKGQPISITSRIITPEQEVTTEHKAPFQIIVGYTDDIGKDRTDSKTVQMILRPRTFMEITTDGGIWVGNIFLAPYVSLGTVIGIPVGTALSLAIRRSQKRKKKSKSK